jgi:hypothetical protein
MRRILFWCLALAVGSGCTAATAWAQFYQQRSQTAPALVPEVNRIVTVRPAPVASKPATGGQKRAPEQAPDPSPPVQHHHYHRHAAPPFGSWYGGATTWVFWGGGYPVIWSGPYTPAFGPVWPVYPPVVAPVNAAVAMPQQAPEPAEVRAPKPAPRAEPTPSNAAAKARCGKFIGFGDAQFGKQNYSAALDRYQTAAEIADDLPEPVFRQAFAWAAMGRHPNSAKAFRRALKINSRWAAAPFRLDDLYRDDRVAKAAHLETLAKAVEANPFDSDLLVVLAMTLYFDGQRPRSELFFARAAQLGGNEDRLLDDFLPKPGPANAPKDDAARGGKIVF